MKHKATKHDVAIQASIDDKLTYNYLKSSWGTWVTAAETLIEIASKIESDRFFHDKRFVDHPKCNTYYMLIGLALENYLKAAIVQTSLITRKSLEPYELDKFLNKHDIRKLFSLVGLTVESERYASDFNYLTECIEWRGRYAMPTTAKKIRGSLRYHTSRQGPKTYHYLFGEMYFIPVDTIHQFLDMARKNLEQVVQKTDIQTL